MRPLFVSMILAVVAAAVGRAQITPQERAATTDELPALELFNRHPDAAKLYRLVKHFDFDERKLGNFDDEPMYWTQLRGPGLPTAFARGAFDFEVGYRGAPSFRLDIETGNVAYEYQQLDLTVTPISDYYVVGFVRTEGLEYASAIVSAYFVDRFGEYVAGSARISEPIRWNRAAPQPWQRIELSIPGRYASAYALRLQFWILQDSAWNDPDISAIDPIERREVYGRAWFDDFAVFRLPRVQIGFSDPAGLVRPGESESFVIRVGNAAPYALGARLEIESARGESLFERSIEVPTTAQIPAEFLFNAQDATAESLRSGKIPNTERRIPVPDLPPGMYRARLTLLGDHGSLLEREYQIAILPDLGVSRLAFADMGVDVGPWQGGETDGLLELLAELSAGAVKLGIPMTGPPGESEKASHAKYFAELSELVRRLGEQRIESSGVMHTVSGMSGGAQAEAVVTRVEREAGWQAAFNPALALVGPLVPIWQIGAERIELEAAEHWDNSRIEAMRRLLNNFVTIPRIAIPRSITNPAPHDEDIVSVLVPEYAPVRQLPRMLQFLSDARRERYWVTLASPDRDHLAPQQRANDLVRRIALVKAMQPGRVFVEAPFELSDRGGELAWQPREEFVVVRTLLHHLSGRRLVTSLAPDPQVLGLIFENAADGCLIIWSWDTAEHVVDLYLGGDVSAVDLKGNPVALERRNGKTRLRVGAAPLIVRDLDIPLVLLQASFHVAPAYIELNADGAQPTVRFRNPYSTHMIGEVRIQAPRNWRIEPTEIEFDLAPGESFAQGLKFVLPPQEIAQRYDLRVELVLRAPDDVVLHLDQSLMLGLRDIRIDAHCVWQGDTLLVTQTLTNLGGQSVSFDAFCEPPGRARLMSAFLSVAPGETVSQVYAIPNARALARGLVYLGISETNGDRALNQFAEVPP